LFEKTKINEKEAGVGPFLTKKTVNGVYLVVNFIVQLLTNVSLGFERKTVLSTIQPSNHLKVLQKEIYKMLLFNGPFRSLFHLFSIFSNKQYNF